MEGWTLFAVLAFIGFSCCVALVAYRRCWRNVYVIAKILASAGFVAVAVLGGATNASWSALLLAGLVIAAVGDGAMAMTGKWGFPIGLSCFALAYCIYTAAFACYGTKSIGFAFLGLSMSALAAAFGWLYVHGHLPQRLRPFVMAYFFVMAAMLGTGIAAAASQKCWVLLVGVLLVATSDLAVVRERFIIRSFTNKIVGLLGYYTGQMLIALAIGVLLG